MRAPFLLAFVVVSWGSMATFGPSSTQGDGIRIGGAPDAARDVAVSLSASQRPSATQGTTSGSANSRIAVGETLPETIELREIPEHETYRYAVVNDHRVIVDAISRTVVYVVR